MNIDNTLQVMHLFLMDDGRDIDRLVDVRGRELRIGELFCGTKVIYDAVTGSCLDNFSQGEIDQILDAGETHVLDAQAGTNYTIINW